MGLPGRAVLTVDVNHGLIEQLSRGEYSTICFSSAAVVPQMLYRVPVNRNTIER